MTDVRQTNIGPREQRRRRILGATMLAIGAIIVIGQMGMDANRLWRLATVIPFFLGALGLIQAQSGT